MDSLARTRKLPSLPVLESSSSALERVMLPWFQQGTMVGTGLPGARPGGLTTGPDTVPIGELGPPALRPPVGSLSVAPAAAAAATRSLTDVLFQALGEGKEAELQRTSSLQSPSKTVLHLPPHGLLPLPLTIPSAPRLRPPPPAPSFNGSQSLTWRISARVLLGESLSSPGVRRLRASL